MILLESYKSVNQLIAEKKPLLFDLALNYQSKK